LINDTDDTVIESASTRITRQKMACNNSEPKTVIVRKSTWLRPSASYNSEKSAIEAIAILKM
jgi:hypothetical protein